MKNFRFWQIQMLLSLGQLSPFFVWGKKVPFSIEEFGWGNHLVTLSLRKVPFSLKKLLLGGNLIITKWVYFYAMFKFQINNFPYYIKKILMI